MSIWNQTTHCFVIRRMYKMAHHLARTSLLHEEACAFGGGGGGGTGHSAEMGFIIFQTEFKQKLTYGDLVLSSKLCAPSAVYLYQRWPVLAKRSPSRRVRGRGALVFPKPSHVLTYSSQTGPLTRAQLCVLNLKIKIVVQFDCVLICLPSIRACATGESGAEFLGHPLFTGLFLVNVHPPHSWFW